jgi:hypothetical protein
MLLINVAKNTGPSGFWDSEFGIPYCICHGTLHLKAEFYHITLPNIDIAFVLMYTTFSALVPIWLWLTLLSNPIQYEILSANVTGCIIQTTDYPALGGNGHWSNPSGNITIVHTAAVYGWSHWALHVHIHQHVSNICVCIIVSVIHVCTLWYLLSRMWILATDRINTC